MLKGQVHRDPVNDIILHFQMITPWALSNGLLMDKHNIYWAAKRGHLFALESICDRDGPELFAKKVNEDGGGTLQIAVEGGHAECVSFLLEHGANPNSSSNSDGHSALYTAVQKHQLACMKILIKAGASPDGVTRCECAQRKYSWNYNYFGSSTRYGCMLCRVPKPLFRAANDGFFDGIQVLIEAGADLNHQSNCEMKILTTNGRKVNAYTALDAAVIKQHIDTVRLLLQAGADPNLHDSSKNTVLHMAMLSGCSEEMLQLLDEAGINIYSYTKEGKLPWELMDSNSSGKLYLHKLKDHPRSLKATCRPIIRRQLGVKRLNTITRLPLPEHLKNYLNLHIQ